MVKGNEKCKGSMNRVCCYDGRWACSHSEMPCTIRYRGKVGGEEIDLCPTSSAEYYKDVQVTA